jgi:hypothetical protein
MCTIRQNEHISKSIMEKFHFKGKIKIRTLPRPSYRCRTIWSDHDLYGYSGVTRIRFRGGGN